MTTEAVSSTSTGLDVAGVVAALRTTFATGRTRPASWRVAQLQALEALMTENETAIIEALTADLGRQPFESWFTDIVGTTSEAKYAARHVQRWMRRDRQRLELPQLPGRGWVEYEPYGTVLIIGAWNLPFLLTLGPLVGALAAGNTVVLKPSELAPASSRLMADLVPRYLDPDAVAVVEGDGEVSQELIAQGFDRILFTGSTQVGRQILAAAAPHLTPVTLELGGKSPVIVAADADIDVAAKRIAWTKLINSGQVCVAPDYVLVDASVADRFVEKVRAAFDEFQGSDGPGMKIVNERHFDRLDSYLEGTHGKVVCGGGRNRTQVRIDPTLVVNPDPEDVLMQEEIFGPILPVVPVESVDQAIEFVNARPKPLAAYLFTKSRSVRNRVVAEVSAGGMLVNHLAFQASTVKLPFGGVGASGMGAYHGRWGFEEFSHRKAVLTKPTRPDLSKMLYPPYSERAWKMARSMF